MKHNGGAHQTSSCKQGGKGVQIQQNAHTTGVGLGTPPLFFGVKEDKKIGFGLGWDSGRAVVSSPPPPPFPGLRGCMTARAYGSMPVPSSTRAQTHCRSIEGGADRP